MHSTPPTETSRTPSVPPPRPPLAPSARAQLRAMTMCAEKTVDRWWRGDRVQPVNNERLTRAAEQLGLLPPKGVAAA